MRGVLSGVAGPQAGGRLEQLELVDAGHDGPGVAEQLVHRAGLHRGVGAPLLDRGADHDRAVAARAPGTRSARAPGRAPCGPAAGRGAAGVGRPEAQDVALDRAERGEPGTGEAGDGGQAGPGRQDDVVRAEAAAVRQDELGPCVQRGHACPRRT